jgi:hypothetical protein
VPISANNDHGVIEGDFANGGPVNSESEWPPPSPHFEDLPESPCAGKRPDAATDGTLRVEVGDARRREWLGHFQAAAQAVGRGSLILQRRFETAQALARAEDVPGPPEPPINSVEVLVEKSFRRSGRHFEPGQGDENPPGRRDFVLPRRRNARREPALDGPEVKCVQLPLDFDGRRRRAGCRHGYKPSPSVGGNICRSGSVGAS